MCTGKIIFHLCATCGMTVRRQFRITSKCAPVRNGTGACVGQQQTSSEHYWDVDCEHAENM
ncbi:hypothetical protein PG997_008098 [Apiospora hydei]|uniref:Uncharacterized protein n=1 Tax=Apiospora hydei TaxID=1337664 RepID=A0ABR1W9U6_9PEZI